MVLEDNPDSAIDVGDLDKSLYEIPTSSGQQQPTKEEQGAEKQNSDSRRRWAGPPPLSAVLANLQCYIVQYGV